MQTRAWWCWLSSKIPKIFPFKVVPLCAQPMLRGSIVGHIHYDSTLYWSINVLLHWKCCKTALPAMIISQHHLATPSSRPKIKLATSMSKTVEKWPCGLYSSVAFRLDPCWLLEKFTYTYIYEWSGSSRSNLNRDSRLVKLQLWKF